MSQGPAVVCVPLNEAAVLRVESEADGRGMSEYFR